MPEKPFLLTSLSYSSCCTRVELMMSDYLVRLRLLMSL